MALDIMGNIRFKYNNFKNFYEKCKIQPEILDHVLLIEKFWVSELLKIMKLMLILGFVRQ